MDLTAPGASADADVAPGGASPAVSTHTHPPPQLEALRVESDRLRLWLQKRQMVSRTRWEYFVHYQGWKSKWDVWMTNESIFKKNTENAKLTGTEQGKVSRGPSGFSKKDKEAEKEKIRTEAKAKREKEMRRKKRAVKNIAKAKKRVGKAERRKARALAKGKDAGTACGGVGESSLPACALLCGLMWFAAVS